MRMFMFIRLGKYQMKKLYRKFQEGYNKFLVFILVLFCKDSEDWVFGMQFWGRGRDCSFWLSLSFVGLEFELEERIVYRIGGLVMGVLGFIYWFGGVFQLGLLEKEEREGKGGRIVFKCVFIKYGGLWCNFYII